MFFSLANYQNNSHFASLRALISSPGPTLIQHRPNSDPALIQHRPNSDPALIQHRPNSDPALIQHRPNSELVSSTFSNWSIEVKALHSTLKNVLVVCTPCVSISVLNHGIANPCTWLYRLCCLFLFMFLGDL